MSTEQKPAPPVSMDKAAAAASGAAPPAKDGTAASAPDDAAKLASAPAPGDAAPGTGAGAGSPFTEGNPFIDRADEDTADHTLPADTIHAYYGTARSAFSGPTALGSHATVIGVLNVQGQPARKDAFGAVLLDPRMLTETLATYVETDTDGPLRDSLETRRVAYLSGALGTGRLTTACVALARRHSPERIAHIQLALETRLADVAGRPDLLRDGHGHLLIADDLSLEMTQLAVLNRQAEHTGATVVVIGRSNRHDVELSRFLVRHAGPAPEVVFRRWLGFLLGERGACIGRCAEEPAGCQGACIESYVASSAAEFGSHLRLSEAVHAATVFAQGTSGLAQGASGDHLARTRLAARAGLGLRSRAVLLLRANPNVAGLGGRAAQHQQAFRIAYAILNGRSLTDVFAATGQLVDLLDDARRIPRTGRTVLELDVDALLDDGFRAEPEAELVPAGSGIARTAQLRDPRLVDALLDVVWNDYDSARGPLLTWMTNLVDNKDPMVRVAVAAAAGRLCGYDFDEVFRTVIETWAESSDRYLRQAAALACESAGHNAHLTETVGRRIRRWVEQPRTAKHDAAARAYATPLGRQFTQYALADLTVIAQDPRLARNGSVARAVQQIYRPSHAPAVLDLIAGWHRSDLALLRGHADRCLVALATRPAEPPRDDWPQLLAHADAGLIPLPDLTMLWRSALRHPWTSAPAWDALRYWIDCAAGDPALTESLAALLREVLRERSMRTRARFYTNRVWRRQSLPSAIRL